MDVVVRWLTVGFILGNVLGWIGGVMAKAKVSKRKHRDCPDEITDAELFFVWSTLMAKLSDVQASIDAQTAAIKALADAIAAKPPAAATEADLDGVKAGIDANTDAVNAIPR